MVDVKLKARYTENQDVTTNQYTLKVEIVEYVNITRDVFVFKLSLDGVTEEFQTVASPISIEKFPANAVPDNPNAFYRKHTVELTFDTLEDREATRLIFESRLAQLVSDWHKLYPYVVSEEEVEYTATD